MLVFKCMKSIVLANSNVIPSIGLGVYGLRSGKETVNACKQALELGYRHIDTARVYLNEGSVGKAIKESNIDRKEIFITSKMWNTSIRFHRYRQAFNKSLKKLGVDYIDLYLLHWPEKNFLEAYHFLEDMVIIGKIKNIGVSNFEIKHLKRLLANCRIKPVINQIEVNPSFNNKELIKFCFEHDIKIEAYSPLGGKNHNYVNNPIIISLAEKYSCSPSELILSWELNQGLIVLPRSKNILHQKENLCLNDIVLEKEDMKKIDALNLNIRTGKDPNKYE